MFGDFGRDRIEIRAVDSHVDDGDAAVEGAFSAQAAWGAFLVKAAFGGVRTPNDVSMGLTAIAEAAAGPARRKVRANARRLTGAKAFP